MYSLGTLRATLWSPKLTWDSLCKFVLNDREEATEKDILQLFRFVLDSIRFVLNKIAISGRVSFHFEILKEVIIDILTRY